jgi:hypothetical protein
MKRLALIGLVLCAVAAGKGQDKWTICHNGNTIEVADPAVMQAHLDHGDCLGHCDDCIRGCCLGGGELVLATFHECEEMGGRFQWDKEAPCFAGGD